MINVPYIVLYIGLFYYNNTNYSHLMTAIHYSTRLGKLLTFHVRHIFTMCQITNTYVLYLYISHGHHGMLSDSTFGYLASTSVLRDFVELPSQLMEHWLSEPEVLKQHARHYETGEVVPDELLERLKAASLFNEGFATVEYTICAMLDMAIHSLEEYPDDFSIAEFEKKYLEEVGMPQGVVMRHRPAHFAHLFASSGYAAGYYVYQWAQKCLIMMCMQHSRKLEIYLIR